MISIKLTRLYLWGMFSFATMIAYGQSEKEIVRKYRLALQKSTDENAIQTMEIEGNFIVQKLNFPITIYCKYKNLLRLEMKFQSMTFLQVTNDSLKWDYNPMTDKNTVTPIDKTAVAKSDANKTFDYIDQDLLNYKELKHELKLLGKEKMDSLEVYVLELTRNKEGKSKTKIYIDVNTSLIYKTGDDKTYRYFANYISQEGFVFPKLFIDSSPEQYIEGHFQTLTFNKALDDSLFMIPQYVLNMSSSIDKKGNAMLASADSLKDIGKLEEADELYTRFIKSNDKSHRGYNSRGLLRIVQKEYYEAIADFTKAIEINPKESIFRNNLGLAKFYLGDKEGAIKDYTKALELDPSFGTAMKNRGLAHLQLSNFEMGAEDFVKAIKLNAKDGEAHFKYGVALAQLDKFEEALHEYALAFGNEYVTAEIYNYKGVSEYKLERYDSASISFQKAARLEPANLQYIENYGRALYETENYQAAAEQFEYYLKKENNQPEIHNLNGLCKYGEENYKGAINDFSRSIELNGNNASFYDNRAAAKEMLEDYVGAVKDYSESIRIYPNDPHVFYKRGIIKIHTSQKMEGCLDLATANEMKYEPAREAIMKNCN